MSDKNAPQLRRSTRLKSTSNRLSEFAQSEASAKISRPTKVKKVRKLSTDDEDFVEPKHTRLQSEEDSDDSSESDEEIFTPEKVIPAKKQPKKAASKIKAPVSKTKASSPKPKASKTKASAPKSKASKTKASSPKPKASKAKALEPKPKKSKKVENKENEEEPMHVEEDEIDELEALNLPELNAPKEWMDFLQAEPSSSKNELPSKKHETTLQSSDDEIWDDVEVETVREKKPVIQVNLVDKKKEKEKAALQKELRLQAERELREFIEDSHKLHCLGVLSHLRMHMLAVKEYCAKHKDELEDGFLDCDLSTSTDESMEDKLNEFRNRFKQVSSEKLPAEKSHHESVERIEAIMQKKIYHKDLDLAMALVVLFLSSGLKARLCVGFVAKPDLPTSKKVTLKKPAISESDETSDDEEEKESKKSKKKKAVKKAEKVKMNYFAEYFDEVENDWIPAHPANKKMLDVEEVEKYAPFNYLFGIDDELNVLDLAGWYAKGFLHSKFRKSRLNGVWLNSFLRSPLFCSSNQVVTYANKKLEDYLLSLPLPKVVSEYKNHPLYVIEKDLLKFEALYPPDIQPIGKVRDHDVYYRSAVYCLQGTLNWIRVGRSVKEGETAYKVVKARPKLSVPKEERVQEYLDAFGFWQTEPYRVPKVIDGKIERNQYGNVYMYRPEMVPEDCVHLKEKGVLQMARTLELEAVPAVTGWEFSGGRNHPVLEGCVVLAKDAEVLRNALREWREIREQKKAKTSEARVLQAWKRLVKGKLLLEKLKKDRFNLV